MRIARIRTLGLRPRPRRSPSRSRLGSLNRAGCFLLAILILGSSDSWGWLRAQETGGLTPDAGAGEPRSISQRKVQLPQGPTLPAVVTTEFFTHGALAADGSNLAVTDSRHQLVPWQVLQAGPGDFCRLAFQTVPKSFTGEKVIRNFGFRARLALGVKRIRLRLRLTPHSVQTPTEPLLDVRFFWEHPERADSLFSMC